MSIRFKILIPMVAAAVLCATIIGILGVIVVNLFVSDFNTEKLNEARLLSLTILEQDKKDAARSSAMVAGNERLVETLASYQQGGDRTPLVNSAVSLMNATGVDFLTIMDVEGNVIVRAHEPDNFGDSLASQENVKRAMRGEQYTTTEKGSAVKLSVRSGTPIFDFQGKQIGVVSLGFRLDQNKFVDYVKLMTNTEVSVFLGDTRVSTTLLNENGSRAVDTRASDTVSQHVLDGNNFIGSAQVLDRKLFASYTPIRDAENTILGMLFVGLDTSKTDARMTQDTWIMIGVVIFLGIVALLVSLNVSRRIVGPIQEMSGIAKRLSEGDVDVNIHVDAEHNTKDETEYLALAFQKMIHAHREQARIIEEVAGGNLDCAIEVKSEKDVIGVALAKLLEKNNTAFGEMTLAARQLDIASTQLADGAQNLAQGSSEQAQTIDRVNITLKELSTRTTEKTKQAKQAAALSEAVKCSAERGNRHMNHMMEAVGQISDASEAIGKVIKVIDDIAFQTNILALNAAVEAAHAGQYGKGFAVVADEVRILAAKSAEAAKDTSDLIANSIEKAKLGAQISTETATAFSEIVGGINDTTDIVEEIAEFMQLQNNEIESVSRGVDDIDHIVQSISASAEESAASSQEMSAQATSMAAILSGYHLRAETKKQLSERRGAKPRTISPPHY